MSSFTIKSLAVAGAIASAMLVSTSAVAGSLIVSGDEWQLSNSAYSLTPSGTNALVASIAANSPGSNYLVLTGNSNVPTSELTSLISQLGGLGKTVTTATALPASLSSYNAVLTFGQLLTGPSTAQGFGTYLTNGGSLYVSLGGGFYGSAAAEANYWNPFLNNYGISSGSVWGPVGAFTTANVTAGPSGAGSITWGNGQYLSITGPNASAYVTGSFPNYPGTGTVNLLAISTIGGAVPEPATWLSMLAGLGLTGAALRRGKLRQRVRFAV